MSITFISTPRNNEYTVPAGAIIMMPSQSNPTGFTRFTAMDTYYLSAGDATSATVIRMTSEDNIHSHSVSAVVGKAGSHTHTATGTSSACSSGERIWSIGYNLTLSTSSHTHVASIVSDTGTSSHNHSLKSTVTSGAHWLPRFRTLVAYKSNSNASKLPNGAILMWWGTDAGTLPSKFKVCHGQDGTPDMRVYYISFYPSQITGGDLNPHSHTAGELASGGAHTHTVSGNTSTSGTFTMQTQLGTNESGASAHANSISYVTSSEGAHTHDGITVGNSTAPVEWLPTLAVNFIQYQEA